MTGTAFGKWYWSDWMADPAVRASSYAARGLWMDLLCIAATADPTGYVSLNGRPLTVSEIARLTGGDTSEVEALLGELDRNGVFTRDRHGRIYSRRMIRDAKRARISQKNGRKGGNPNLRTEKGNSARDKGSDNGGHNTQKPEARIQKPASAGRVRERAPPDPLPGSEAWIRGLVPPNATIAVDPDVSPILALLREPGMTPPDVQAGVADALEKASKPIQHWRGMVGWARAAAKARLAGKSRPSAPRPPPSPEQDRAHRLRLAIEHFRGEWRQGTAEEFRPGSPGCTTDPILVEEARRIAEREGGLAEEAA